MNSKIQSPVDKWALFRFSVVGSLLANPPAKGELRKELERLSRKIYIHPITNESTVFHFSTIEAWYYKAKKCPGPYCCPGQKNSFRLRGVNCIHPGTDPDARQTIPNLSKLEL